MCVPLNVYGFVVYVFDFMKNKSWFLKYLYAYIFFIFILLRFVYSVAYNRGHSFSFPWLNVPEFTSLVPSVEACTYF